MAPLTSLVGDVRRSVPLDFWIEVPGLTGYSVSIRLAKISFKIYHISKTKKTHVLENISEIFTFLQKSVSEHFL